MQIVIDISENIYNLIVGGEENRDFVYKSDLMRAILEGTPLDSVKAEIERLKHQYTDVSGYRWWNNAIDNCLHTIRDVCDTESEG